MTNQLQHHQQQRRAVDLRIPAIDKYAYCLCLHVKPTTIFIAVFKLIRALLFASILLNTEFTVNEQVNDFGISLDDRHKSTAIAVNILLRIIMASVSAVGIYAVISGRAALLMPLYALLLVEFFFALPAFYNRDLDPSLTDNFADFRNYNQQSIGVNNYTRYSLMLFSTIIMIVKIYFLCVIWKCYRYLRLIELVSPIRLSEIYPHFHQNGPQCPIVRVLSGSGDSTDLGGAHNMAPPPYESIASHMKPPNYEEAMKSSSLSFVANPNTDVAPTSLNQQQTVVFTSDPNMDQHQSISTQAINDDIRIITTTESVVLNPVSNNINSVSGSNDLVTTPIIADQTPHHDRNNHQSQSGDVLVQSSVGNSLTIIENQPNITTTTTIANLNIPDVSNSTTIDTH